jgi:hypothetical protein
MVGLVAEEAYAALALGVTFPDPASWAGAEPLSDDTHRALDGWRASWDLPAAEGRGAREALYGGLAAGLTGRVAAEALDRELALLSEGVMRAQGLNTGGLPPHVADGILRAGVHSLAAREARNAEDLTGALEALVRGGDALREVGPEAVARALQSEVEGRMGRLSGSDAYTGQELERLQRLVRGGREALTGGEWGLAIRRAFYAKGLLDGNG